jgi:hypothetical protein
MNIGWLWGMKIAIEVRGAQPSKTAKAGAAAVLTQPADSKLGLPPTGFEGRVEIESQWTARKRERAEGKLPRAVELPHSSQKRA